MPIFDFSCTKCGTKFEKLVRSHKVIPPCQVEGCDGVCKRAGVSQNTGFVLKGGGWASTGYSQ